MEERRHRKVEKIGEFNYKDAMEYDLINKIAPLLKDRSFLVDSDTHKIRPTIRNHAWAIPWVFIRPTYDRKCGLYHKIAFDLCKIIPEKCLGCWKVVVRPRTLEELFKLHNLMIDLDRPAKCGIEVRDYVHGLYGGYFYTDSLEDGRARYKEVREAVDEHISPDVSVILKRYCTEFEKEFGRSDEQEYTEHYRKWEEVINNAIEWPLEEDETIDIQPLFVKDFVYLCWIEWAYQNGDETYKLYNDGKPLVEGVVTYHES